MINNYTLYHLHSDYSLLDSTTPFQKYVDWAVDQGMTAIGFCEHGNIFNWTTKKEYCDSKGIKYIHGVELYLTEKLFHKRNKVTEKKDGSYQWELVKQKIRDNYHIILLAKNLDGIKEINTLVSMADDEEHSYYKPRISFEEAVNISDNVFVISACLAAPLWSWKNTVEKYQTEINSINVEIENYKLSKEKYIAELNGNVPIRKKKRKPEVIQQDITKCDDYIKNLSENIEYIKQDIECITFNENPDSLFFKLFNRYDYLEIQPHVNSDDQKEYNKWLLQMSKKYEKPIICGTDTHNYDSYAAECRTIMQIAKGIEFLEEDTFDLTLHTCTELAELLASQGVLDEGEIQVSIANTNAVAALCDDFELDKSFKYPVFETPESDSDAFYRQSLEGLDRKIEIGAIKKEDRQTYIDRIEEEMRVLRKVGMGGFMLSMHKFLGKMRADGLPLGFSRGSCFTDSAIVKCLNGYKTINSVTIHDKVLSEDNQYHQVIHTTSQIVCDELIEVIPSLITIDAPIRCTKDHLFYVIRDNIKQYVKACTLKSSDLLIMPYRSNTYKYIPVEEILTLPKMEYKVYDIKVADTHNYTVNGFVVHNCGGCLTAYLTDITDIDPIVWGLSFERFCNENRVSLGD